MNSDGRIVIYSRKSKFTGKGESIENQIEMCRQYIRVHFGEGAADNALIFEDEGFSGGTLDRPQFNKMMAEAKKKTFCAIVVYRLDRISRNIGDFVKLIEQLNDMNIDFISIKEQFDTSSPMGRAMMYISSVFSQLERETIAERIRDNMRELSKSGRWLGGISPTGYESEPIITMTADGKTKKVCRLKLIPEEISVVRLIFDKFLETGSLTKTETYLLQNRHTTKNGKQFTRFTVKGILTNPVYLIADESAWQYLTEHRADLFSDKSEFDGVHGIMAYSRTLQQPGKAHRIRPMEEWIVSVGGHEGVIEGKAWVKAQRLLEQNRSKGYRKPRGSTALLSGLLVCGGCGAFMRPKLSTRLNTKGEPIYAYLCSMKERSRGCACNMKNCGGNLIDADVIAWLKPLREDGTEFIRQLMRSKRMLTGARQSRAGLEDPASSPALTDIEFDLLTRTLSSFAGTVDGMSVEQKRAAIRAFVKQIIWDGTDAHVVLFGSDCNYEFPKDQRTASSPSSLSMEASLTQRVNISMAVCKSSWDG